MANDITGNIQPMVMANLYWSAGFIEGEGSFTATNSSIQVRVSQCQVEPLERLKHNFGGTIYLRLSPSHKNRSPISEWLLSGGKAAGLMMTLHSLMSPRRKDQITKALNSWRIIPIGVRSKYSKICKRGHNRWGQMKYSIKNRDVKNGRRCLECHRLRRRGELGIVHE